jgi:hypothetical protein
MPVQVAKSLGVLWIGSVITYWLKTSLKVRKALQFVQRPVCATNPNARHLRDIVEIRTHSVTTRKSPPKPVTLLQLGHRVSGVMLLVTAVSAALPLGVNGCCRLRRVLLDNPKAVDDLLRALAVLEQRISVMCDLTQDVPVGAVSDCTESFPPAPARGPASAITDVSTAPGPAWDEPAMASPVGSGSDDIVHLVPSDWESPRAQQRGVTLHHVDSGTAPALAASRVGDQSVHVSEAGNNSRVGAVVSVGGDQASDHVMLSNSQ